MSNNFFAALASILLSTGEVEPDEQITTENLDRALKAYIRNVINEVNN